MLTQIKFTLFSRIQNKYMQYIGTEKKKLHP